MNPNDKGNIIDFRTAAGQDQYEHEPKELAESDEVVEDSVFGEDLIEEVEEEPVEIPAALLRYEVKMYVTGFALLVGAIGAVVYLKAPHPLILLLGVAFFAYKGLTMKKRFLNGEIREVAAICSGAKVSQLRDHATLTFRTPKVNEYDNVEFFNFENQTKRSVDKFIPGQPYLIYYDIENPHNLLCYSILE